VIVRFDSRALYNALDARREERSLTWQQVADEIGIALSTIKRTSRGGRMEVDGMLSMVDWLDVPIETFVLRNNR
jgi:transcriptional regulator with XRE-family HTH domain